MISDKRVIKTRNSIKNALMVLLVENEISKITVSDLAEKAQINRSTFYLHYNDVLSVMKDIEKEIETEIAAYIKSFDPNSIYESIYAVFTNLTEILNEKPVMKNYILNSTSSDYLIGRLKDIFVEKTVAALKEINNCIKVNEIIFPLSFAAAGILDTYVKWAHSDKSTPLEDIIKLVSELTQQILEYIKV